MEGGRYNSLDPGVGLGVSALELNYWSELLDSGIRQAMEDVESI